jgi:integrase
MARQTHRLTVKSVANKTNPGYYADGGGLYLQVTARGGKSWIFRFALAGQTLSKNGRLTSREMGLGSTQDIPLAEARAKAADCRRLVAMRIDPIEARKSDDAQKALAAARSITFSECAEAYIKAHCAAWKNEKHVSQWENTIETYCTFGSLAAQDVDTGQVLKALEPIWTAKPETASRLRGRIERVLDWAKVRGYRSGENPARWRGHLDKLLPKLEKRKRVRHHPALPFQQVPEFMSHLHAQHGIAARALEFTILTAARTNEVIAACWSEFDLENGVWTIPATRMKAHVEHRVPLAPQVVQLLRALPRIESALHVFPGQRKGRPLSNMAMLKLLQDRMEREHITVHGFRSTFRDWAAERTNFPREVCEMALAHTIMNQVEAAYRRGELFEKRRQLMEAWSKFCHMPATKGEVISLRKA